MSLLRHMKQFLNELDNAVFPSAKKDNADRKAFKPSLTEDPFIRSLRTLMDNSVVTVIRLRGAPNYLFIEKAELKLFVKYLLDAGRNVRQDIVYHDHRYNLDYEPNNFWRLSEYPSLDENGFILPEERPIAFSKPVTNHVETAHLYFGDVKLAALKGQQTFERATAMLPQQWKDEMIRAGVKDSLTLDIISPEYETEKFNALVELLSKQIENLDVYFVNATISRGLNVYKAFLTLDEALAWAQVHVRFHYKVEKCQLFVSGITSHMVNRQLFIDTYNKEAARHLHSVSPKVVADPQIVFQKRA